ncbi:MAG: OsmC family protein [Anaerolineae bacterium]|nr:OsmC family protein [Anaerolineae bacterium]
MAGVQVTWMGGQLFKATDDAGHAILTGADSRYFKPPDLLLVALAVCIGVDIVAILEKKRQKVTGIQACLTKQNAPDPPWTIEKIEIEWVVRGHNLSEKAVWDAIRLAEGKYCSVSASLKSEIVMTLRLIEEGG